MVLKIDDINAKDDTTALVPTTEAKAEDIFESRT